MLVLGLCFLATAWADKLNPALPPPPGAAEAGGDPGDLNAPGPLPGAASEVIPIVAFSNTPNAGDGSYSFSYETGNGISAQEEGVQKEAPEGPGTAAQGAYSYTGTDGVVYTVIYTADENGFVPKGDHLPTSPPVPAEIQAALEQNAAAEAATATAAPAEAAPAPAATPAAESAFYYKTAPNYNYNNQYSNQYNNQYSNQYSNQYRKQLNKNFNNRFLNRYYKRY